MVFSPLGRGQLRDIVKIHMKNFAKRLVEKDIELELTKEGAEFILGKLREHSVVKVVGGGEGGLEFVVERGR